MGETPTHPFKLQTFKRSSNKVVTIPRPQAVSPPGAVDMEFGLIQQSLPKPNFPGISETDCLTLNITVPRHRNQPISGLPVLVFIHGGGFQIGGNWWPQYDFAKLVQLSATKGHPIIGININYRLGVPGFFTCKELRAAGYKPNNGLRDQRMALQWIQGNIEGFGGDPEEVTVMGESAGGGKFFLVLCLCFKLFYLILLLEELLLTLPGVVF